VYLGREGLNASAAREVAPASSAAAPGANAMTVDVEDYFQVQAFESRIRRADWPNFPSRVERNTDAVLALFAEQGVRATFFTLGWVAERHPNLIRRIVAGGHELASHGWAHHRVGTQDPEVFRADVSRAKKLLEDIGGVAVAGYRAASFSIGRDTLWALDVLGEAGYRYSSSIYPIQHDHYGIPDAPRVPFRPGASSLVEIPMTTLRAGGRNFPCSGGGYFRLLPYALSRWAMNRVRRADGQPCIFYFHPWEIDPHQPRIADAPLKSRLRHYTNLATMAERIRRLLREFAWDRMDRVYADAIANTPPAR
jgi:polysaccharide deacetylase family protein (PEP-CTERM system associated)